MDTDAIQVVQGGVAETTTLLSQKFDHIFYTGSGQVGKIVMTAASKNLTPVTLELGGKSPVYVHGDVDPLTVAKRVFWAKHTNCGQTCITADYVLVKKSAAPALYAAFKEAWKIFFPKGAKNDNEYARIINVNHFKRLETVLNRQMAIPRSEIIVGGEMDINDLLLSPTVIKNVKVNDPIMEDEIFGPLLPILEVEDEDEAIRFINSKDKPLSLYIFTDNKKVTEKILKLTSSGNAMVNDLMLHTIGEYNYILLKISGH
jgi:aldehyde dehydrogenase (NAD+)